MTDQETIAELKKTIGAYEKIISDQRREIADYASRTESLEEEIEEMPQYNEGRAALIHEIHQAIQYQNKDPLDVLSELFDEAGLIWPWSGRKSA